VRQPTTLPRAPENRVLRRILGPKRDEMVECSRKLRNEGLHNLYSLPDIIRMIKSRRMRWAGNVPRTGEKRNAFSVFVGKPEGKRPLGRPRSRWKYNIKLELREIGGSSIDLIELAQDKGPWRALVNTLMNFRVQ
jgi:hypothetical protein